MSRHTEPAALSHHIPLMPQSQLTGVDVVIIGSKRFVKSDTQKHSHNNGTLMYMCVCVRDISSLMHLSFDEYIWAT